MGFSGASLSPSVILIPLSTSALDTIATLVGAPFALSPSSLRILSLMSARKSSEKRPNPLAALMNAASVGVEVAMEMTRDAKRELG